MITHDTAKAILEVIKNHNLASSLRVTTDNTDVMLAIVGIVGEPDSVVMVPGASEHHYIICDDSLIDNDAGKRVGDRIEEVHGKIGPYNLVRARHAGEVTAIRYTREYGLHVRTTRLGCETTRYAYLSDVMVGIGQKVKEGEMIGRCIR